MTINRPQDSRYWGTFANAAALPNVAASPNEDARLLVNDLAGIASGAVYLCTTPTVGAAVWSPLSNKDRRTASLVVGNELEGDTLADCDYLDTGNGAQLAAAIAAAGGYGPVADVHVRRGVYTLSLGGGPTTPIEIPAQVRVWGAGATKNGCTRIIAKSAGEQGIFLIEDANQELSDMYLEVPASATGTGQFGAIRIASGTAGLPNAPNHVRLRRLYIHVGAHTNGAIRAGVHASLTDAQWSKVICDDVFVYVNELTVWDGANPTYGFYLDSDAADDQEFDLRDCHVSTAAVGVLLASQGKIRNFVYRGLPAVGHVGIYLSGASAGLRRAQIDGCEVELYDDGKSRGILATDGCSFVTIGRAQVAGIGTTHAGKGIDLGDTTIGSVMGCTLANLSVGVELGVNSQYIAVVGNAFDTCATPIDDDGTALNNNVAHNVGLGL